MQVFDASSMLYAWDTYPIAQFPGLWGWMEGRFAKGIIQISEVAVEEVGHKAPDCVTWLKGVGLQKIQVTDPIMKEAFRIKGLLGIDEDRYGTGVDENDLIIIATAKHHACELVTDEGFQAVLPKSKQKYKIPAVCGMSTVNVNWIGFLAYLKRSAVVFG